MQLSKKYFHRYKPKKYFGLAHALAFAGKQQAANGAKTQIFACFLLHFSPITLGTNLHKNGLFTK
jgi:hypothetical protein